MFASGVIFQLGCKKDDFLLKPELTAGQLKFFSTTLSDMGLKNDTIEYFSELRLSEFDSHLAEIQAAMIEMDQKFNIIERIKLNYGFPIWRLPLKAESLHTNVFSYCFPIVIPNKKWTNGYIRILKNSEGELRFYIAGEREILERISDNNLSDEDIENIGIKNHFDHLIFNSTNQEIEKSLVDIILSLNQRVKFRAGCFDDYVVATHNEFSVYQIRASDTGWWMLVLNGVPQPQTAQPLLHPDVSLTPKVFTTMVLTAIDPDCGGNTGNDSWIVGGSFGGVVIKPHVYWENKIVNSVFLNACKNRTDNKIEEDDDYSQQGGSFSWSQDDVNKCERVRTLTDCGISNENIIRYLAASEAGFISDNVKTNKLISDFCNNLVINDAMDHYFDCLERFSLTSQKNDASGVAPFYEYLETYTALTDFLKAYNNDPLAAEIYEQVSSSLCSSDYSLGDKRQFSMPKIDWQKSTCDEIFKQILTAMWGHAIYNKCFGGNTSGSFQYDRYFTNMSKSKSCGQSTATILGLTVTGSFEVDFTLSANPETNLYLTSGLIQHQGTVFGSGFPLESYVGFGPNSNAPLIHFGIQELSDDNFIKILYPDCN